MDGRRKLPRTCSICTPRCIRVCPIAEQRSRFSHTVRCPQCGGRLLVSDEACPSCGMRIHSICPECLAVNSDDGGRCGKCGYTPRPVDPGPSQWYSYSVPDEVGRHAAAPGVAPEPKPGIIGKENI